MDNIYFGNGMFAEGLDEDVRMELSAHFHEAEAEGDVLEAAAMYAERAGFDGAEARMEADGSAVGIYADGEWIASFEVCRAE